MAIIGGYAARNMQNVAASLLEDEQTSKHGGGGRYNVILEFKGSK
jgi:hypothetical protein